MKFSFFDDESKLYDLMQFPRILYLLHNEEGYGKDGDLFAIEQLDNKIHLQMIQDIHKKLIPFKEEIDTFYANEFLSNYDVFILLTEVYSFFGCPNIETYIDQILSRTDEQLKEELVFALLRSDNDQDDKDTVLQSQAEALVKKQADLMQYVKDLPTESSYKWNVLMLLENTRDMLQRYKQLLLKLRPMFEQAYEHHIKEYTVTKEMLQSKFAEQPKESFLELTQYMVDVALLQEENKILISLMFPYSFVDRKTMNGTYIVWGSKMEDGFKIVNKKQGDKIEKITKVFKILGDKTRYEVLKLIASGTTSTKVIAKQLGVTSATISYHINSFVTNNVITLSSSKNRKYDVDFDLIDQLWVDFISDLKQES